MFDTLHSYKIYISYHISTKYGFFSHNHNKKFQSMEISARSEKWKIQVRNVYFLTVNVRNFSDECKNLTFSYYDASNINE